MLFLDKNKVAVIGLNGRTISTLNKQADGNRVKTPEDLSSFVSGEIIANQMPEPQGGVAKFSVGRMNAKTKTRSTARGLNHTDASRLDASIVSNLRQAWQETFLPGIERQNTEKSEALTWQLNNHSEELAGANNTTITQKWAGFASGASGSIVSQTTPEEQGGARLKRDASSRNQGIPLFANCGNETVRRTVKSYQTDERQSLGA